MKLVAIIPATGVGDKVSPLAFTGLSWKTQCHPNATPCHLCTALRNVSIVAVALRLPVRVVQEDADLLMVCVNALMRMEGRGWPFEFFVNWLYDGCSRLASSKETALTVDEQQRRSWRGWRIRVRIERKAESDGLMAATSGAFAFVMSTNCIQQALWICDAGSGRVSWDRAA